MIHFLISRESDLSNLRDFLLRPFEVAANLAGVAHALLEALAGSGETGLRLSLEVRELAVLGIEFARTA